MCICAQMTIDYVENHLMGSQEFVCVGDMSCGKTRYKMWLFGWVEYHIACVQMRGRSVCDGKFVCLRLREFESVIVILSTCSHVLSVLLIITTTSVRLTRGSFAVSFIF